MKKINYKNYRLLQEFIANYKVVSLTNIMAMFPHIPKGDLLILLKDLTHKGYIKCLLEHRGAETYPLYSSREFNPNKEMVAYGNSYEVISKSLFTLSALKKYYNVTFHKLCFYPSTIKLTLEKDGEETLCEICYLPYSEDNSVTKKMGFYFDDEYDKTYEVHRILICEKTFQIADEQNRKIIEKYIHNISNFVWVSIKGDVQFFNLEQG